MCANFKLIAIIALIALTTVSSHTLIIKANLFRLKNQKLLMCVGYFKRPVNSSQLDTKNDAKADSGVANSTNILTRKGAFTYIIERPHAMK